MWFGLSLVAILFWSGSDFFSKLGSPSEDKYSHWKMLMAVGLVMGLHASYEVLIGGTAFGLSVMLAYLPVSFLYILAMELGYVGLRYIELSVSSPICNSSGAAAALLCFFFLKQALLPLQVIAVLLIVSAIYLLSLLQKKKEEAERNAQGIPAERRYKDSFIAIFFPILYCLIDGLGTFADAIVLETLPEDSANVAYEYTFLLLGILSFLYVCVIRKQKLTVQKEAPKLLAGICETVGQFAYIFAIGANAIASAPLISSYCMFSVLWARIFLREKLSKAQYGAIALAVAGIIIMGAFGE